MKVIILAGGKGTRLPESAKNIPKPLVKVGNKPILQHQINLLKEHGLSDIRFSLGYKADQIINHLKGKYEYIIESEPLGTGEAISLFFQEDASDYGLVQMENERIIDFLEKPNQKCSGHINAGFYILSPKVFENVSRETFSIERDLFPEMVKKEQLIAYIHQGCWTDLGTEERLKEAGKIFKNI